MCRFFEVSIRKDTQSANSKMFLLLCHDGLFLGKTTKGPSVEIRLGLCNLGVLILQLSMMMTTTYDNNDTVSKPSLTHN